MIAEFSGWLNESGVQNVINFIYEIIKVIRVIVPIGLIVMTTIDIAKKVINPNEKDGQKKIMIRAIAALIVFFIPTLIDFVFNIGGMEKETLDDNVSNTNNNEIVDNGGKQENNNNTNKKDDNSGQENITKTTKLTTLNFHNCPGVSAIQKTGDKITLYTDIPSTFNGEINWNTSKNIIKVTPSNDKKSTTLEILDNPNNEVVDITVKAGGLSKICSLYVQKTKQLSSLNITNCPGAAIVHETGDKITLNTDIPSTFSGEIDWTSNKDIIKVTPSNNKRSATLEILNSSSNEVVSITVEADGLSKICSLYVKKQQPKEEQEKINEIKITNCPNGKTFKNGEIIRLYTNIPNSHNEEVFWGWGISEGEITVLTETNQEYAFYVSNLKRNMKFTVLASLDSVAETAECTINLIP